MGRRRVLLRRMGWHAPLGFRKKNTTNVRQTPAQPGQCRSNDFTLAHTHTLAHANTLRGVRVTAGSARLEKVPATCMVSSMFSARERECGEWMNSKPQSHEPTSSMGQVECRVNNVAIKVQLFDLFCSTMRTRSAHCTFTSSRLQLLPHSGRGSLCCFHKGANRRGCGLAKAKIHVWRVHLHKKGAVGTDTWRVRVVCMHGWMDGWKNGSQDTHQ